jgi:hypothetical protein
MLENGVIIENENCQWGEPCEVVEEENFITGLGMKSALPFGLKFINMVKKW